MIYKNTKTGAVVESASPVSGGNWVEVKEEQPKRTTSTAKKKAGAKK